MNDSNLISGNTLSSERLASCKALFSMRMFACLLLWGAAACAQAAYAEMPGSMQFGGSKPDQIEDLLVLKDGRSMIGLDDSSLLMVETIAGETTDASFEHRDVLLNVVDIAR